MATSPTLKKSITGNHIEVINGTSKKERIEIKTNLIDYKELIKVCRKKDIPEKTIDGIRELVGENLEVLGLNKMWIEEHRLSEYLDKDIQKDDKHTSIKEKLSGLNDYVFTASGEIAVFLLRCEQMLLEPDSEEQSFMFEGMLLIDSLKLIHILFSYQ